MTYGFREWMEDEQELLPECPITLDLCCRNCECDTCPINKTFVEYIEKEEMEHKHHD